MKLILLAAMFVCAPTPNDQWTGFLGEGATTASPDAIPTEWTPDSNVAWKQALPGYGQSTPVVWQGKVFLTCVDGPNKEKGHVVCLDLKTGDEQWRYTFDTTDQVESSIYVSRAAPTPVLDDQRVIAFFESGDLMALSHDGNLLWQRSLSEDYGKFENRFCIASSPVQSGDGIFILADHEGPSYLVKINKADGKTAWKTDRPSRTSWSSPAWMMIEGKPRLVVSSQGSVDGYDPESGEQVWSFDQVYGNTVATPAAAGTDMFIIGASPGQRATPEQSDLAGKSNMAMKIVTKDGKAVPEVVWRAERATCSFGSPMVHAGHAYWVTDKGVLNCFDVATGELKYKERVDESVWATPIGIGDRVFFFGKGGSTTVIAAGPDFEKLASNRLWVNEPAPKPAAGERGGGQFGGRTQYGVAVADGNLLVRTGDILYCVRKMD